MSSVSFMVISSTVLDRIRQAFTCLLLLICGAAAPAVHAAEDYLDPESAFRFSATLVNPKTVAVTYAIAEGYYMYRERFQFSAEGAKLGAPVFPAGKVKFDDTFQKNVETYRHTVTINLPVEAAGAFTLNVTGQGCADLGLCYAPMASQARLSVKGGGLAAALQAVMPGAGGGTASAQSTPVAGSSAGTGVGVGTGAGTATGEGTASASGTETRTGTAVTTGTSVDARPPPGAGATPYAEAGSGRPAGPSGENGRIDAALKSGKLLAIVPLFLLLGLGLAFTPCVLPMVPILSSIIVGEGADVTRGRGFLLSLAYACGMAIVYTALGVAAGLAGEGLAAALQNPWVLGAFAVLMIGLSLSMFGVYELQVPGAIQARLTRASQNQRSGKMLGVFVMGALSALIVGPCVAAPLAGALVYISQTRDVVVGGSALFAMAIGMSLPLLLVGVSAGALLPRAGVWMDAVKRFFGVLMLAVALWMVSPVLPVAAQMAAWAVLGIGYGAYLLWTVSHGWALKAVGLLAVAAGMLQMVGLATGGADPLQPLAHLRGKQTRGVTFARIKSSAELDAALASMAGKTVLLDFYADWCISCKEMEKLTFTDAGIQEQLANTVLLQADVTANDAQDRALLKRFQLFGPPGIILFDRGGREIQGGRIIGYQSPKRFATSLAPLAPG